MRDTSLRALSKAQHACLRTVPKALRRDVFRAKDNQITYAHEAVTGPITHGKLGYFPN